MAIQQLTQPILNPIAAFDATQAHSISFVVIGGAQVVGNRLIISNNQTGAEIYNQIQATMKLEHTIPANTLTNGGYYNAVVYTIDNGNNESVASTAVPFYCYSQPVLTIDNIPATETIENGTYTFTGTYIQQESESLNSYQYTLYNSNKEVLSQTPLIYYETDSSLSHTFVGMSNDTSYYVELSGETINGTKMTSGLRYFTVRYEQPASFAICDLVNNCEDGYIQISSNIVAIDGISNPDPPIYIDDKEVDLREPGSWVEWNSGFRIQSDFTMRVWGREFTPYQNIITLTNDINSNQTPNKIELKWMIGDVIKSLPTYMAAKDFNVNITNSQVAPIEDLTIGGNSITNSNFSSVYTPLDYIRVKQGGYINTLYAPKSTTKVEMGFNISKLPTVQNYPLFGARVSAIQQSYTVWSFVYVSSNSNMRFDFGSQLLSQANLVLGNNVVIKDMEKNILNGVELTSNNDVSFNVGYYLYLCGLNNAGTNVTWNDSNFWYDVQYCKIWENNNLVRNYVPCYRNIDNATGLYDLVNNVFYRNAGTGSIEKGNPISLVSPNYPANLYSVGDIKNLINVEDFNITYNQQYYQSTNTNFLLEPNYLYNLSFDYNINSSTTDIYYSIGYGTTDYAGDIASVLQYKTQTNGRNNISFIVPDNIPKGSNLWVKFAQTIILADIDVDISNIQLERGKSTTEYQAPNIYNIYPTSTTKNLYNYDTPIYLKKNNCSYTNIANGYNIKPSSTTGQSSLAIGWKNCLNAGDTYTISFSQLGQFEDFKLYTTAKNSQEIATEISMNNNIFVAPDGVYDLQLVFGVDNSSISNYIEIWNIQIEASNVITSYEPYMSNNSLITLDAPLRGIGNYRDLICLESPNLLNPENQNVIVQGNTTYYLSQTGNISYQLDFINEDNNIISSISLDKGSFTTPSNCVRINMPSISSSDIITNQIQINIGSSALQYYPYITEPSIIRYYNEIIMNGTENWIRATTGVSGKFRFAIVINDIKGVGITSKASMICNILGTNTAENTYFCKEGVAGTTSTAIGGKAGIYVYIEECSQMTTTEFKNYLAQQYNNNPMKLIYTMSKPEITPLSQDNIAALQGLVSYTPITNVFTNNEVLGELNLNYVSGYSEQQTENAYVLLRCWNANSMPYICHSNYIDIPKNTDKVFIWMRRKNNLFDLKIENLYDYGEGNEPSDTTKPIVSLDIDPNNVTQNEIPVTANSIDDNGLRTVRFSKNNGVSWDEVVTVDGLSSTNSYTFTGLTPNTTYTIRAEAIDLAGNIGGISQQVTTKP